MISVGDTPNSGQEKNENALAISEPLQYLLFAPGARQRLMTECVRTNVLASLHSSLPQIVEVDASSARALHVCIMGIESELERGKSSLEKIRVASLDDLERVRECCSQILANVSQRVQNVLAGSTAHIRVRDAMQHVSEGLVQLSSTFHMRMLEEDAMIEKSLQVVDYANPTEALKFETFVAASQEHPMPAILFDDGLKDTIWSELLRPKNSHLLLVEKSVENVPIFRSSWTDDELFSEQKAPQLCRRFPVDPEQLWLEFTQNVFEGFAAWKEQCRSALKPNEKFGPKSSNKTMFRDEMLQHLEDAFHSHMPTMKDIFISSAQNKNLWGSTIDTTIETGIRENLATFCHCDGCPTPKFLTPALRTFFDAIRSSYRVDQPLLSPDHISNDRKLFFIPTSDSPFHFERAKNIKTCLSTSFVYSNGNSVSATVQKMLRGKHPQTKHLIRQASKAMQEHLEKLAEPAPEDRESEEAITYLQFLKEWLQKALSCISSFEYSGLPVPVLAEIKNAASFHVCWNFREHALCIPVTLDLQGENKKAYMNALEDFYPVQRTNVKELRDTAASNFADQDISHKKNDCSEERKIKSAITLPSGFKVISFEEMASYKIKFVDEILTATLESLDHESPGKNIRNDERLIQKEKTRIEGIFHDEFEFENGLGAKAVDFGCTAMTSEQQREYGVDFSARNHFNRVHKEVCKWKHNFFEEIREINAFPGLNIPSAVSPNTWCFIVNEHAALEAIDGWVASDLRKGDGLKLLLSRYGNDLFLESKSKQRIFGKYIHQMITVIIHARNQVIAHAPKSIESYEQLRDFLHTVYSDISHAISGTDFCSSSEEINNALKTIGNFITRECLGSNLLQLQVAFPRLRAPSNVDQSQDFLMEALLEKPTDVSVDNTQVLQESPQTLEEQKPDLLTSAFLRTWWNAVSKDMLARCTFANVPDSPKNAGEVLHMHFAHLERHVSSVLSHAEAEGAFDTVAAFDVFLSTLEQHAAQQGAFPEEVTVGDTHCVFPQDAIKQYFHDQFRMVDHHLRNLVEEREFTAMQAALHAACPQVPSMLGYAQDVLHEFCDTIAERQRELSAQENPEASERLAALREYAQEVAQLSYASIAVFGDPAQQGGDGEPYDYAGSSPLDLTHELNEVISLLKRVQTMLREREGKLIAACKASAELREHQRRGDSNHEPLQDLERTIMSCGTHNPLSDLQKLQELVRDVCCFLENTAIS